MKKGDTFQVNAPYVVNPVTSDTITVHQTGESDLSAIFQADDIYVVTLAEPKRLDLTPIASWVQFRKKAR